MSIKVQMSSEDGKVQRLTVKLTRQASSLLVAVECVGDRPIYFIVQRSC